MQTTWDAAQRKGSLSIYIWESTDLINWGSERLIKVEDDEAGMVWAPDAIWDASKGENSNPSFSKGADALTALVGQYLVHWASKFVSLLLPCTIHFLTKVAVLHVRL